MDGKFAFPFLAFRNVFITDAPAASLAVCRELIYKVQVLQNVAAYWLCMPLLIVARGDEP
jgi:hypothetical protein